MPYGYGPVGISGILGFIIGIILWIENQDSFVGVIILRAIGGMIVSFAIISLFTNRKAVTGPLGGLITGVGVALTLFGLF